MARAYRRGEWDEFLYELVEYEGWEDSDGEAVKFGTDEDDNPVKWVMRPVEGDDIEIEQLNEEGKATHRGRFDAAGLSAGEIEIECWRHLNEIEV